MCSTVHAYIMIGSLELVSLFYVSCWNDADQSETINAQHVELRMRITIVPRLYMTGHGIGEAEYELLTLKIKSFPFSQNTTGESEQQKIKLVWPYLGCKYLYTCHGPLICSKS